MKQSSTRLAALTGLLLCSLLAVPGAFAATPTLSLSINPASPGGTTTATLAILDAADVESFSLELNFASGTTLVLPASNWLSRGAYFPTLPFGATNPVEQNDARTATTRKKIYMGGFKPAGNSGVIGAVTFTVSSQAANGATQVLTLSGDYFSKAHRTAAAFAPVTATFEAGSFPNITVSPGVKSFGRVDAGSQSTPQTFTVTNGGNKVMNVTAVTLAGTNPGDFQKLNDLCTGATLQPAASCTVDVRFVPTTIEPKNALLALATNDPDTPTMNVALRGNDFFTLTLTTDGTGTGIVLSNPIGIACNTNCSAPFDAATDVTLQATADEYNLFKGWNDACSGTGNCTATMSGDRTVTVTFDKDTAHRSRIDREAAPAYFASVTEAYLGALAGETIMIWGIDFTEDLILGKENAITMKGGYSGDYLAVTGTTIVKGTVTFKGGPVTLDNLTVK